MHSSSLGGYTFRLHSRKATYFLTARTSEEADEWMVSLQYVSPFSSIGSNYNATLFVCDIVLGHRQLHADSNNDRTSYPGYNSEHFYFAIEKGVLLKVFLHRLSLCLILLYTLYPIV